MDYRDTFSKLVTIDVFQNSVVVSAQDGINIPLLEMPAQLPSGIRAGSSPVIDSESLNSLISEYTSDLEDTCVVFGAKRDPFADGKDSLASSFAVLEALSRLNCAQLILQTRSPLVILAAPILKRSAERIQVTIALETECDEACYKTSPRLARPSERIKTAQTLKQVGVSVRIQYCPFELGNRLFDAQQVVKMLSKSCSMMRIAPYESILKAQDRIKFLELAEFCQEQAKPFCLTASKRAFQQVSHELVRSCRQTAERRQQEAA